MNAVRLHGDDVMQRMHRDDVRNTTQDFLHDYTWRQRQKELRAEQAKVRKALQRNYWPLAGVLLVVAAGAATLYGCIRAAEWMLGE